MKSCTQHLVRAATVGLTSLVLILGSGPAAMAERVAELYQEAHNATFSGASFNFTIDVPAGKRLIVESASARVTLPAGQRARAFVSGNFPTAFGVQYLTLEFQGTFDGSDVYTTTQPVRLYIQGPAGNPGTGVFNIVRNATTGSVFAEVSIAGFLEDAP
jgi:hypothetical protein